MKTIITSLLLLLLLLAARYLQGQDSGQSVRGAGTVETVSGALLTNADPLAIAHQYVSAHLNDWGLSPQDVEGITVNDMYTDKTTGITRIYFLQRHRGIPVYNAILNVSITREGKVFFAGNRFMPGLAGKINTTEPVLSASQAVAKLAAHLGLPADVRNSIFPKNGISAKNEKSQFVFEKGGIAKEDITARLSYQPHQGKVLLAWDILFSPVGKTDKWSTRVDALTGAVLNEYNWTVYCFENESHLDAEGDDSRVQEQCLLNFESLENVSSESYSSDDFESSDEVRALRSDDSKSSDRSLNTGAQYNVWPVPTESPSHGPRTIVTDPADPLASPFGWHDQNGQPGPEYTITWGNNVRAYQDRKDIGYSNDAPNGGANLYFDFPYQASWEPEQHTNASVVNLFYWANYMHDFAYHFGFDEEAGNFQKNNYGNGGVGNDHIFAIAQLGADIGFFNTPFYIHGNEGTSGEVYMTEFITLPKYLTVNEPASVAGTYHACGPGATSGWGAGAIVTATPVSGEVVVVDDGIENPIASDACEDIVNASELAGKIALIDKGLDCAYGSRALKAQNAGAIGVIFCNYNEQNFHEIGPSQDCENVQIPVVSIDYTDAETIREYAGNGLKVSLVNPGNTGPAIRDYSLDNGFIAHEYGHGISWRLAGGPNAACFDNYEQMDEGWSDFFALATTVQAGDTGGKKRGIGTYMFDMPTTHKGIRRYPYSTDMSINPLTYGDVAQSHYRHDVGEVWGNVIWDMYWALVGKYGWSGNNYDESSGNYKAIRLVFEGLKNIPCSPGFVDGRNAILAADETLYNGENQCLLWEVFARRGLGYSADQGSPFSAGDQKEAFDLHPLCSDKMLIEKSVTDFIQPGDDIQVSIKVGNFKTQAATGIVVTDEIPAGLTFKPNSSNLPAALQGNIVSFNLGNMNFAQETTITYTLESSPDVWSLRKFLDNVPSANNSNWLVKTVGSNTSNLWSITDDYPAHSGIFSWHVKVAEQASEQVLELDPDVLTFHVNGSRPALRFYHRYLTDGGFDGGLVELREVGSVNWKKVGEKMLRNGYTGTLHYLTFGERDLQAFSGNSGTGFQVSYVDLSEWAGKDIQIRFRFANLQGPIVDFGWLIDDIEFMDLLAYNGEACVTSAQGDLECAIAPETGTIVDSRAEPVSAEEQFNNLAVKIYPNPASDWLTIALTGEHKQDVNVSFFAADGRLLFAQSFNGSDYLNVNTSTFPAGLYLVKVSSAEGQFVGKVVVQK